MTFTGFLLLTLCALCVIIIFICFDSIIRFRRFEREICDLRNLIRTFYRQREFDAELISRYEKAIQELPPHWKQEFLQKISDVNGCE